MSDKIHILNSNPSFKLPELIGLGGCVLMFFAGIPIGIIGIRKSKTMEKLRFSTIVLSIINLSAGIIEIIILITTFCAVVLGGVSA